MMLEHHLVQTNGITLHTAVAGPADGPAVILLHGFPEFWYGWRKQIPALVEAGFRVWVPDQRGYNLSDKPRELAAYRQSVLAEDILGLIDATGQERVYLAGHDWGAAVAWRVASLHPERLRHVAILNVPHPSVAYRRITSDPRQMVRSTYIAYFQLPRLPEALLSAGNWRLMARAMRNSSLPGAFSDEELAEYRRAWSQPRAMTSMLNWYRAAARLREETWPSGPVAPPVTIIWGKKDFALVNVMAEESLALCRQGELIWLPENSHWVQHEAAERVNAILLDRFTA